MKTITFTRKGKTHTVTTTKVQETLYGTYGILVGKTGHLNKLVSIR